MKKMIAAAAVLGSVTLTACAGGDSSDTASVTTTATTRASITSAAATTTASLYDQWSAGVRKLGKTPVQGGFDLQMSLCKELRSGGREAIGTLSAMSSAEYLRQSWGVGQVDVDTDKKEKALLVERVIIPILCPDQRQAFEDAKAGTFTPAVQTKFGNGKYIVGERLQPGTYTIPTPVSDCYWERSDGQGNIIDNNFISIAQSVTVTISASDAGFTSKNCGTWELAE